MTRNGQSNGVGDSHSEKVLARFTKAQLSEIVAAMPEGEELAAFVRRMALQGARGSNLRTAAAFLVAALHPTMTMGEALKLWDQHVLGVTENKEGQ